jgi:hypothetical protein
MPRAPRRTFGPSMSILFRAAALLPLFFALAVAARAEDRDCNGFGSLNDNPQLTVGRVNDSVPRAYFLRSGGEAKECPADSPRCRQRSYLVSGDQVVLSRSLGPFICADFLDARHMLHLGWLLASAVTSEAATPMTHGDWIGNWTGFESSIVIKPSRKPDALWFSGDATWGAHDPVRVKNGAINLGSFDATAAPIGPSISFTVGDQGTLPVGQAPPTDCTVWLRRLGSYLLASDNKNCGGANVSFDGLYWRSPTPLPPWSGSEHEERDADVKTGSKPPRPSAATGSNPSDLGAGQTASATTIETPGGNAPGPAGATAPRELRSAATAWIMRAHPDAKTIDSMFSFMTPTGALAAVFIDYENGGTHFARDGMVFRRDASEWVPDGVPLMVFGLIVGERA